MTNDMIRVFLPLNARDAHARPFAEIPRLEAGDIVAAQVRELVDDAISTVRWSDVLATQILSGHFGDGPSLAHALLALAAIDARPMGRVTLNSMRYLYARIEPSQGILSVTAVDSPDEREDACRRLFQSEPQKLAA